MEFTEKIIMLEKNFYRRLKGDFNLTRTDVLILSVSRLMGECTTYLLEEEIEVDRSLIVRRLKILEDRGYVTRKQVGRKKVVSTTDKSTVLDEVAKGILI